MPRATIPDSVYFRNWKKSTDTLRGYLQRKLDTIAERAAEKRREADEIEREGAGLESAIALLDELLPASTKVKSLPAPNASGRWSEAFDQCKACGTTEKKHAAHGLCTACYSQERERGRVP